jgi:signal transduction histidine kinase
MVKAPWLAIALTWLVTMLVVLVGVRLMRQQVREQIVRRDGEILWAMARTQPGGDEEASLLGREPFAVFVTIGGFEGIMAARMFDAGGGFLASVPDRVREGRVGELDLAVLRRGQPISRFEAALSLEDLFLPEPGETGIALGGSIPAVRVFVPLGELAGAEPTGFAEFVLDGRSVAREFELLDQRLLKQAALTLLAAFGATGGVLAWAFRQLARGNRLLQIRTEDLQRANRELSQAARATALGAVTAHLVHGLKNPVTGLQSFMAAGSEVGVADEESWREARAATHRMQALIGQVVRVLREHESDLSYDATLDEVGEAVRARARALAGERGVVLDGSGAPAAPIDNRSAGLFALVLTNLLENAIQATPRGGVVRLHLEGNESGVAAEVADQGPGLPESVRERLFQPNQSTKEGGSGLGLAISHQLALALGGTVKLVASGPDGTCFRIEIPRRPGAVG